MIKRFHDYKEPEAGAKKKKRVIDLTATSQEDVDLVIEIL